MSGRVEYEPASVKALLAEMKDTAELLIDLSFSAVLHGSDDVAAEVLRLEERMDVLQLRARMSLLMAARNPEDAETLAPVLGVVGAAEKISDAAGDVAKVVLEDIGVPDAMRAALPEAVESLVRAELAADSPYAGRTLGDVNLETETGVRVIAIRRGGEWILNPDRETDLRAADVLLLRGPEARVGDVSEAATGERYEQPDPVEPDIEDLERAVDSVVLMKNMSELAVDLAYGAVLFDSGGPRQRGGRTGGGGRRPEIALRGVDAAGREPRGGPGVAARPGPHRHLDGGHQRRRPRDQRGRAARPRHARRRPGGRRGVRRGARPGRRGRRQRTRGDDPRQRAGGDGDGMRVIAVRRPDADSDEWVVQPGSATGIEAGDVLLAKGTRTSGDRLRTLAAG